MLKKTKIIVIFGGKSGEHEVSIKSARSIIAAIDKNKYEVIPLAIAKNGTWLKGPAAQKVLSSGEKVETGQAVATGQWLIKGGATEPALPAVVFPVLHGPYGEDGTIQGMMEMLNVPYVGAGVLGSALGMDKVVQKQLFLFHGLPVAPFTWFLKDEWLHAQKDTLAKVKQYFKNTYPLFVKPANLGSSVGISKAHNEKELIAAIAEAAKYDQKILIEKGIENILEVEVSILGNETAEASVCGQIIPANEFYDYDAKYIDENTALIIPAKIKPKTQKQIQEYGCQEFKILNCAGLARADFFVERVTEKIWVSEINTMPGFTSISMYPKLWETSGISYSELVEKLIQLAVERWKEKQKIKTSI